MLLGAYAREYDWVISPHLPDFEFAAGDSF
jgi:hypothetical protein